MPSAELHAPPPSTRRHEERGAGAPSANLGFTHATKGHGTGWPRHVTPRGWCGGIMVECLGPSVCGRVVQHVYMRVVCAYSHICWVRGCARRACRFSDGWAWCCARSTFNAPNTNTVYIVYAVHEYDAQYTNIALISMTSLSFDNMRYFYILGKHLWTISRFRVYSFYRY